MSRSRLLLAGLLASGAALTGCTTMGTNVKGSFSCVAPDGICAPSSLIDDRALALISGEDGDRMVQPAGPYAEPPKEGRGFQTASAPARTRERVLRIVFPAQIDAAGRLREKTAVHAVVEQGGWEQALASNAVATTPKDVAAATGGDTLLAAVERADPPAVDGAEYDPGMPSAAAVVAARAQAAPQQLASPDPIGDIKDQVSRRLAAPRRQPVSRIVPKAPAPATMAPASAGATISAANPSNAGTKTSLNVAPTSPARSPTASASSERQGATGAPAIAVPAQATDAGRAAIAAVAANPAVRAGLARAEPEARTAAQDAKPLPVLRATSFPGVQQ